MSAAAQPILDLTKGRPPRRRFVLPVSLRMFVALLAILCVVGVLPFGGKAYRQWAAIREIEQANGTATFRRGEFTWLSARVPGSWLEPFKTLDTVHLPFSKALEVNTTHLLAVRPRPWVHIEGGPPIPAFDRTGELDELRAFLAKYRILLFSRHGDSGGTLLHHASGVWYPDDANDKRVEILRFLLKQGADPNDRSYALRGAPPYLFGARKQEANLFDRSNGVPVAFHVIRNPDVLAILLAGRADPKATISQGRIGGWTLLHEAAETGVVESARLVLKQGIPVDTGDAAGKTPLHVAARAGHVEVVRLLLARGADAKARTNDGQTTIFYAATEFDLAGNSKNRTEKELADRREIVELLSAAGAPLDLFRAIALGRPAAVVEILGEMPETVNSRNSYQTTPLDFAVELDQREIAIALIDAGTEINATNSWDSTALHTAASLGRVEIAKILIAHQADVSAADTAGLTPLHVAARQHQPQCVRLLLAAGAKRAALDQYGRTPLDLASRPADSPFTEAQARRLAETVELLRESTEPVP